MTMAETSRSTALMTRPAEVAPEAPATAGRQAERRTSRRPGAVLVDRAVEINVRLAPIALRLSLAVVFVWFGALKIVGHSPVHDLLVATLPFLPADLVVPALGVVEVVLGLAVASGVFRRVTLLVLVGHLVGTFLTFVTATTLMFQDGNPLMLTSDGEFVVKNLVLISAALVLIGVYSRPAIRRAAA
jgi:putative oxidoreductase